MKKLLQSTLGALAMIAFLATPMPISSVFLRLKRAKVPLALRFARETGDNAKPTRVSFTDARAFGCMRRRQGRRTAVTSPVSLDDDVYVPLALTAPL